MRGVWSPRWNDHSPRLTASLFFFLSFRRYAFCIVSSPAHLGLFLYPFLNTVCTLRQYEYLRLTSLGVIGALVKMDDSEVINFLLQTEIIPLALRIMDNGSELSKTVATFIIQKILLDEMGLRCVQRRWHLLFACGCVCSLVGTRPIAGMMLTMLLLLPPLLPCPVPQLHLRDVRAFPHGVGRPDQDGSRPGGSPIGASLEAHCEVLPSLERERSCARCAAHDAAAPAARRHVRGAAQGRPRHKAMARVAAGKHRGRAAGIKAAAWAQEAPSDPLLLSPHTATPLSAHHCFGHRLAIARAHFRLLPLFHAVQTTHQLFLKIFLMSLAIAS